MNVSDFKRACYLKLIILLKIQKFKNIVVINYKVRYNEKRFQISL
jgi:hypothetical protein